MKILVIDAQGGGIGKQVVTAIKNRIADAEITAVGQSNAKRILIPVNHCDNIIVGVSDLGMNKIIDGIIHEISDKCVK